MPSPARNSAQSRDRFAVLGQAMGELVHDLANELAVLQSWALLAEGEIQNGRLAAQEVGQIVDTARELGQMLHDVLGVVTHESLSPEVAFSPVMLTENVVTRRIRSMPSLTFRFSSSLPPGAAVHGRASFWIRIVANLLGNASRYARSEIRVSLSAEGRRPAATQVVLRVEDDGPGIPDQDRESVFQPGWRGNQGQSGLGLASVAWSVAQLGGEVAYRDEASLGGALFEVRVPLGLAPVRQAASQEMPCLRGYRILVIDNDRAVRVALSRLMARAGAEVRQADPTEETLERSVQMVVQTDADVVLLDLRVGAPGGIEIWHRLLRELPSAARSVIFITGAAAGEEDWEAAVATGQPVLLKPFDLNELASAIARLPE